MSNLEHLIENEMVRLEDFYDSGDKDVNTFNEQWRLSIIADVNYEGINISPDDIMEICTYFLCTWCGTCDKEWRTIQKIR